MLRHESDQMAMRIEAYLDGDLPDDERAAVERRLAADPDWAAEVDWARQMREALRALPQPACPDRVTRVVLAEARRRQRSSFPQRLHTWVTLRWRTLWQPVLAMSVLLAFVASALLLGRPPQPTPEPLSDAEVQQALTDVRWTLAYLSEVSRKAGTSVRDEVLEQHVAMPMHRALHPLTFQASSEPSTLPSRQ